VVLIDGDEYKDKNRGRQRFRRLGNKAEVKAEELAPDYQNVLVKAEPIYVKGDNVVSLIRENDVVFLCVDNNATRKLISDRCEELDHVLLISGGNELTDGGAQVFLRRDGQSLTLPLANPHHVNIQYPKDENPGDVGCDELAESVPQVLFTNNLVAAKMLGIFYSYLQEGKMRFDEVYCDLITGNCRAVKRSSQERGHDDENRSAE